MVRTKQTYRSKGHIIRKKKIMGIKNAAPSVCSYVLVSHLFISLCSIYLVLTSVPVNYVEQALHFFELSSMYSYSFFAAVIVILLENPFYAIYLSPAKN
jgi:hypothetical protein